MLKVKFYRADRFVVVKILAQGDEINKGEGCFFTARDGYELRSECHPAVFENLLYVIGDSEDKIYPAIFKNVDEAQKAIRRATQAIREYNERLQKIETETEADDEDIEITVAE